MAESESASDDDEAELTSRVDEVVSQFFLDTCEQRERVSEPEMFALLTKIRLQRNYKFHVTLSTSGSAAEFYIDPMLSCIGDTDIMFYKHDQLAIPEGYLPYKQLPAEFDSPVKIYEILDSDFPGYVYLRLSYLLTECPVPIICEYCPVKCEPKIGVHYQDDGDIVHGPAVVEEREWYTYYFVDGEVKRHISVDKVFSVCCLLWPPQAADWPTRRRNYGWPDSATVGSVVSNGCDVVGVAHRLCRDDELMGATQHRLSFSRAEVALLNSWTQVQQIVYHMLRFFLKTEQNVESDNSGAKTLSNYHIKTLMLWACEVKPRSWWNDDFNVVEICVKLLHVLGVWLRDARCKQYFINNCNLLDHLDKCFDQLTASKLESVTKESLSKWFVNNYIRKCIRRCTDNVCALSIFGRLFDGVSEPTDIELYPVVSSLINFRREFLLPYEVCNEYLSAKYRLLCSVSYSSLTMQSASYLVSELEKIDDRLTVYLLAVAYLHVAYKTTRDSLTEELLDVLPTIRLVAAQTSLPNKTGKGFYETLQKFVKGKMRLFGIDEYRKTPVTLTPCHCSELVEGLQHSAIDVLTILRQREARDFGSWPHFVIVTSDYEALYAYKCGDYRHCLQLSTSNVLQLFSRRVNVCSTVSANLPELIQLLDDDIASLIGLIVISQPQIVRDIYYAVSQPTMSLYLMAQCQMKLSCPATSLAQALDYVGIRLDGVDHSRQRSTLVLEELILKFIEHKMHKYISENGHP